MNTNRESLVLCRITLVLFLMSAGIAQSWATTRADFNGDGFADLAVGAPGEDIRNSAGVNVSNAGAVNVIYGSSSGLSAGAGPGNQFWTQNSTGILDACEANDRFGAALAAGDFNHDGFADLAVGVPGENSEAGAVNVIYGSATGLSSAGNQLWSQNSSGILDNAEAGDHFGATLAVGDFNGDGFDDLAIGVSGEDLAGVSNAGGVNVLYGSSTGLSSANNQFFSLNLFSGFTPGANDQFGYALATGDFGKSSQADLAIGIPGRDLPGAVNAGAVIVLYGSASRLSTAGFQFWAQTNTPDILDTSETDDQFGFSLASGNFGKTSHSDLAIGVPGEGIVVSAVNVPNAGAVNVVYGSATGLSAAGNQFWAQSNTPDIAGKSEADNAFGFALEAADFGNGTYADLVVGVPGQDVSGVMNAGAVHVLYGSSSGLSTTNNRVWTESNLSLPVGTDDEFGSDLAAANFGKSSQADLVVGVPLKEVSGLTNAGAVIILYGSSSGLISSGNQLWTQDSSQAGVDIQDAAEADDEFGSVDERCWRLCPPDPGPSLP